MMGGGILCRDERMKDSSNCLISSEKHLFHNCRTHDKRQTNQYQFTSQKLIVQKLHSLAINK